MCRKKDTGYGRPTILEKKKSESEMVYRDMRALGTTTDGVHDRTGWRRIVSTAANPQLSGSG